MKKALSLLLVLICIFSVFSLTASATSSENAVELQAEALYEFGLFKGTGTDSNGNPLFSLDIAPTRQQAIVMLIRLLGKEDDALTCESGHPFSDVDAWADRYIAYAYNQGLTNGTSATTFSGNEMVNSQQYITLLLRALGYRDKTGGDFTYSEALDFSDSIGMTAGVYSIGSSFLRRDIVWLSCCALLHNVKSTDIPLIKKLLNDDVLDVKQYENGLTYMLYADAWGNTRYVNISDNSGATNYIVDSFSLYTIPGTGQHQGYLRLMGYSEQDLYPIYYQMQECDDGLVVNYRLLNVSGQNPIRYQNYMDKYASQLAFRNYSVDNNTIAWSLEEGCPIPQIYYSLFDVDRILGIDSAAIIDDSDSGRNNGNESLDGWFGADITELSTDTTPTTSEWITSNELKADFDLSSYWAGEEVWIFKTSESIKYILVGTPKSNIEKGVTYNCIYNGFIIKVQYDGGYNGDLVFNYDDLRLAGIINK